MKYVDSSLGKKKKREKEKHRPVRVLLISLKKRDKLILSSQSLQCEHQGLSEVSIPSALETQLLFGLWAHAFLGHWAEIHSSSRPRIMG